MNRVVRPMINKDSFIIISDPLANRSTCAVDFKTGSINDPASKPGLSHLLEHVISSQFSGGKIGKFNASTAPEHTNFRFDTDHRSFAKALKVFVSCLNSPSIKKDRVEAEKHTLNSEFEKNRYDQATLRSHIFNMTNDPKHPLSGSHHGSTKTLKDISVNDLKEFMDNNYLASNSKVAIVSALPYDEIKKIVDEAFKGFRPSKVTKAGKTKVARAGKTSKPVPKIFSGMELPQLVTARLDDNLVLCFEIENVYDKYRTKPQWILSYLINTKRKGSLLKRLKELGLATDVFASVQPFSFSSLFYVEFKPTREGLLAPEKIVSEFFSYLKFIKDNGYPEYIFKEQQRISEMGFKFREQNEGMAIVKDLARLMHYYPAKDAERFNSVILEYSKDDFNRILNCLTLNNLKIMLCRDDIAGKKKDPYYGIEYNVEKLTAKIDDKKGPFKYPEANRFIMDTPAIYEDDKQNTVPYKLIDDERGEAWFQQHSTLKLPMLYLNLLILSPTVNKDPFSKLCSIFYTRIISEMLEETLDETGEAGLSFGLDRDDRGISLFFSGYSQKMPLLFKEVISILKMPGLENKILDAVKEGLRNDYLALENGSAFSLAQYFKYQLIHKASIPYTEYINFVDKVSVNDMNTFVKEMYESISLDGHIYGNISPKDINGLYDLIFNEFSAKRLNKDDVPRDAVMDYGKGNSYAYLVNTRSLDHCWSSFYQFGQRTIRLSAIIQLGHMFLSSFFFDNIRGKKQLGYLAETRIEFFEKVLGLSFAILSDDNPPEKLAKEAEKTLADFLSYLKKIPSELFENSKRALVERVNKNNRTLEDWMNDVFLTAIFKGDTQYAQKLSKEIASLSMGEVAQTFKKAFNPATRARLTAYASPEKIKPFKGDTLISDIKGFKACMQAFSLDK
jgi:secreted Zn-dependent insulinase-like peptidase